MNSYSFKIRVTAETLNLLTVGMGRPVEFGVEVPFYRTLYYDSNGRFSDVIIIPGSTIKGALRSASIRVAWILDLYAVPEIKPDVLSSENDDVSKLFGAPNAPTTGKIIVSDARIEPMHLIRRTRIRINRKKNIVEEGALFTEENLPIRARISFEIDALELSEKEVDLLLLSLLELAYNGLGRGGLLRVERIECVKGKIPDTSVSKLLKEAGIIA